MTGTSATLDAGHVNDVLDEFINGAKDEPVNDVQDSADSRRPRAREGRRKLEPGAGSPEPGLSEPGAGRRGR